jgi:hypothetical protein
MKRIIFLVFLSITAIGYPLVVVDIGFENVTVTAGNLPNTDSITITGTFSGTNLDFSSSTKIFIKLSSDTLPKPLAFAFPINAKTYTNNKYNCTQTVKGSSQLFQYDTKTHKFSFSIKKMDLTGLSCPFKFIIKIGAYSAQGQLTESIVNGSKPCPFQLLMGVQDSLDITSQLIKLGKTVNTDTISLQGLFSIDGAFNLSNPFVLTVGSQTFTVKGAKFSQKSGIYSCTNAVAAEGGLVSAIFDTNTCQFTVSVKNTTIAGYGAVNCDMKLFGILLAGYEQLNLGAKSSFSYDELTQQNQLGAQWNYSTKYSYNLDGDKGSGTSGFSISVGDTTKSIDGHECVVVHSIVEDEDIALASYTDGKGTHGVEWGMDEQTGIGFMFRFNSDQILYPQVLRMSQTSSDSGTFTGDFDLNDDSAQITNLSGKVTTSWSLIGYENVTVPAGPFKKAIKSEQNLVFNGQMHVYINDGDVYYNNNIKMMVTGKIKYWSDTNTGIVKTDQTITIKLTAPGLGSMNGTFNTLSSLNSYSIPQNTSESVSYYSSGVIMESVHFN